MDYSVPKFPDGSIGGAWCTCGYVFGVYSISPAYVRLRDGVAMTRILAATQADVLAYVGIDIPEHDVIDPVTRELLMPGSHEKLAPWRRLVATPWNDMRPLVTKVLPMVDPAGSRRRGRPRKDDNRG